MTRITKTACVATLVLAFAPMLMAEDKAADGQKVPLDLKLPSAGFKGTAKDLQLSDYVEPLSEKPRPPFMVPAGLKNLAPGSKVTTSDKNASADDLAKITDGDKEPREQSVIYVRKGTQYVQFDLGSAQELFALVIWHAHNAQKVYRDVVVQVSNDPTFLKDVNTLFNNDRDNTSGLGVGTDREYFETHEGKLVDMKGVKGQFVRVYSKGSTESVLNEYTEVEIYGRPAK